MVPWQGFWLDIEISGNMENQRNPFPHKAEFLTSVNMICCLNIPGPKCLGMQVSKTNDVFVNARYILFDVYEILLQMIIASRKRMFAIFSNRIQ